MHEAAPASASALITVATASWCKFSQPISGDATKRMFNRAMLSVDFLSNVWHLPGVTSDRH